jgi:hypothetical protein
MATTDRLWTWGPIAAWVVLAALAGPVAGDALDGRSTPVVAVVAAIGWVGWGAALVALLVPRTASLTAVRVLVPAGLAGAVAAAALGDHLGGLDLAAVVVAAVACALVLSPWTADRFVDGSSYGPERRIPLRTPAPLALVAVLTWAVVVAGAVAGPLLLAAGRWALGGVATVVGGALVVAGVRSLHLLARRWLVLVPTGMVLHDPLTMPEPQLFLRQTMSRLGPAPAVDPTPELDTEDLTAGASGLVVELVLSEPVELLVHAGRREAETRPVDRVLFVPVRPAVLVAEGRSRRLPVG